MSLSIPAAQITLGILAGGRGTRLGGCEKAWLQRDGVPQVARIARRFTPDVAATLASANDDPAPYEALGLKVVADRVANIGPLGGLDALAQACRTQWLLTVPVDVIDIDQSLIAKLIAGASDIGAWAQDDQGPQPLVALWRAERLRGGIAQALAENRLAVHALQAALGMTCVRIAGITFGNLNTSDDLRVAGFQLP